MTNQGIVREVAMAYYRRGYAIQYNQLSMDRVVRVTPRRQCGMSPEDATSQQLRFLDCSSFVWTVYHEAFGYDLRSDLTWYMTELEDIRVFHHILTHEETGEEQKEILDRFRNTLEVGDIIVYARAQGSSGHAMLYIGNDRFLHCSGKGGGDYDYQLLKNNLRTNGGIEFGTLDCLLTKWENSETTPRSLFQPSLRCFSILRPLMQIEKPTENTIKRMESCKGLDLSVLTNSSSAAIGDTVTYTLVIKNNNDFEVTVPVTFSAASNTCNECLQIPAMAEKCVSFKTTLSTAHGTLADAPLVKVGGFTVSAPRIRIESKADQQQIQHLLADFNSAYKDTHDAFTAAAQAYRKRGIVLKKDTLPRLFVLFDALSGDVLYRRHQQPDKDMAVYSLFGGSGVITPELAFDLNIRTQYLTENDLMPGDVILTADDALCRNIHTWFYDGKTLYADREALTGKDKEAAIDSLLGRFVFAVLRPFLCQDMNETRRQL